VSRPVSAVGAALLTVAVGSPAGSWWDDPLLAGPPSVIADGPHAVWYGPAQLADLKGAGLGVWYTVNPADESRTAVVAYLPIPLLRSRLFDPPLIGVVARETGVEPALAAAIVSVESGFNPRAVSATGARGLMQLTSRTARSLGVYNRFSPRWNLKGGMKYLRSLLDMYGGDVPRAVAAYTLGPSGMERELGNDSGRASAHPYVSKVLARREEYRSGLRASPAVGGHVVAVGGYTLPGETKKTEGIVGWGYRIHSLLSVGAAGRLHRDRAPLWLVSSQICLLDYLEGGFTWRAGTEEYVGSAALVSGNGKVRLAAEGDWEGEIRGGLRVALLGVFGLWALAGEDEGSAGAQLRLGSLTLEFTAGAVAWDWEDTPEDTWYRLGGVISR
jgi:hypothetical protein